MKRPSRDDTSKASSGTGSFVAELDDLLAIEAGDVELAEPGSQQVQAEALGTTDCLANFRHIRDMQVDQVGECLDPVLVPGSRLPAQVDFSLNSARSQFGVLAEREAVAEVLALQRTWTRHLPEANLLMDAMGGLFLRARRVLPQRYRMRKLTDIVSYKRRTCARLGPLRCEEKRELSTA